MINFSENVEWVVYWQEEQQRSEVNRSGNDRSSYYDGCGWQVLHDSMPPEVTKMAQELYDEEAEPEHGPYNKRAYYGLMRENIELRKKLNDALRFREGQDDS